MSLCGYQSMLARLATDSTLRDAVRLNGDAAFRGAELTARERARLLQVAFDPGLDVTAMLISSFRLGKILSLLPLTRVVLGERRLGREVKLFWKGRPPTSFYALEEVLAFCDYLEGRLSTGLRVAYLREVLYVERAMLELRRVGTKGVTTREVRFRHDPTQLLPCLVAGRRPRGIRALSCALVAVAEQDGTIRWSPNALPEATGST
jgi:hypothetical protein